MGFNRGGGLEFTPLPLSSDENQGEIDANSGTPSVLGRFIYEVSGTTIVRGGCANGELISGIYLHPPDVWLSAFQPYLK